MKSNMAIKGVAIIAISMLLVFILQMIEFKVDERNQYRELAKSAISQGWSGSQLVVAPILRLTLSKNYIEETFDKNLKVYVTKNRTRTWSELHIADELTINGEIVIQERYKGIYKIPVYETVLSMEGRFSKIGALKGSIKSAELISSFSDMRGISSTPSIRWGKQNVPFNTGKDEHLLGHYISADITALSPAAGAHFSMQSKLRGLDSINFTPVAKQVELTLKSDWQHPYFMGRYLPDARTVDKTGFAAQWNMTEFATSIQQSITQCQKTPIECAAALRLNSFGVGLHNPIDIYQKTDRSLKYGFLFILLTFAIFCLFETLKRIQIHPIQYGLVGAALSIFYLLLISLSEHISFGLAYAIATTACVGLIWFYLKHVFKNTANASIVALGMTALYGMLYMILKSEDFALLMGATLTFLSLGALMVVTRNIDWYALNRKGDGISRTADNRQSSAQSKNSGTAVDQSGLPHND